MFQKMLNLSKYASPMYYAQEHGGAMSRTLGLPFETAAQAGETGPGQMVGEAAAWTNPFDMSRLGKPIAKGLSAANEWTNPISLAQKFFATGGEDRTLRDDLQIQDAFTQTREDFSKRFDGAAFDPANVEHQKAMNEMMQRNMPKELLESLRGGKTQGVVADVQSVLEEFRVAQQSDAANPELVQQTSLQIKMADYLRQIAEGVNKPTPQAPLVLMTENTAGVEAENTFREQPRR
ncbi:MAG: hypothetical protein DRH97_05315 [Chloroflexi bacterium]|nr:MAG: hypothetical protein DRH97_05315 [Chloroflexota bacterium]